MEFKPPLLPSGDLSGRQVKGMSKDQWLMLTVLLLSAVYFFTAPRFSAEIIFRTDWLYELIRTSSLAYSLTLFLFYLPAGLGFLWVASHMSKTMRMRPSSEHTWWSRGGMVAKSTFTDKILFEDTVMKNYPNSIPMRAYRSVLKLSGEPLPLGPKIYLGASSAHRAEVEGRKLENINLLTRSENDQLKLFAYYGSAEPRYFTPENFPELDWPGKEFSI